MEDREATEVNRTFFVSLGVGVVFSVAFLLSRLGSDDLLRTKLYGAAGVLALVTVVVFAIVNFALSVRRRVIRRRNRWHR